MSPAERDRITTRRFAQWGRHLARGHATPLLTVGLGHDERGGEIVLCLREDVTDREVIEVLTAVLRDLTAKGVRK